MKTLIFYFLLAFYAAVGYSQEVTQLEEARVSYAPFNAGISVSGNSYSYAVNEDYAGEFQKDPIAFLKSNFDIHNFISQMSDKDYNSYQVVLNSSKGFLQADYDKDGELQSTSQKFKNILLPLEVRQELYESNKGWTMTKNKYIARGTADVLEKAEYKIRLQKDNQKKNVVIDARSMSRTSVVSN